MKNFLRKSRKDLSMHLYWLISTGGVLYLINHTEFLNDATIKHCIFEIFLHFIIFSFQVCCFLFRHRPNMKFLFFVLNTFLMINTINLYMKRAKVVWYSLDDYNLIEDGLAKNPHEIKCVFLESAPEFIMDKKSGTLLVEVKKNDEDERKQKELHLLNKKRLYKQVLRRNVSKDEKYHEKMPWTYNSSKISPVKYGYLDCRIALRNLKSDIKKHIVKYRDPKTWEIKVFVHLPPDLHENQIKVVLDFLQVFRFSEYCCRGCIIFVSKKVLKTLKDNCCLVVMDTELLNDKAREDLQ